MDHFKYLKKLNLAKRRGVCAGLSIATGVIALAVVIYFVVKHLSKKCVYFNGCSCGDDESCDKDEGCDENGCAYTNEKDFA